MTVVWSEEATRHLETIYAYLEINSAFYASSLVNRLVQRADSLGDFPEMGQIIPEQSRQLRQLIQSPYRIIYRISETNVETLAVIHGARGSFFEAMR
jgi:toxin ParE1/3/4